MSAIVKDGVVYGGVPVNSIEIGVISPIKNIEINENSWVKKSNNVVSINFVSAATEAITGWEGMASIPKEFAPPSNMYFSGSLGGNNSVLIMITPAGWIYTTTNVAAETGIYFAVSYVV